MKGLAALFRSVAGVVESAGKCEQCGATTCLGEGICLRCLLEEGLEVEGEASVEVFKSVLGAANVSDTQWRIGNYEILQEIGRGGMGVIYRARQRHSRRIVALKRVLTYHADSHETLTRFRREAEAAASLDHPNILPVYEVSETEDGLPFFSMKLATGGSLRTIASALRGKVRECVQLMAKVARAIAYAHAQGILHRDLQPGNILLDARGEPLVSDFGLAKWLDEESDLTQTLTTFGTPGYIAPEQAEGANFSPAADIYSLGAILFNLLAGSPPFVGANALSVIRQAAAAPAPKLRAFAPSLGRDLEIIVARCLECDPKARYLTAAALAEDLERWLAGRPIIARPIRAPTRVWRWSRRNPILATAASACLLLALAVIWLLREQFFTPESATSAKSIAVLPFANLSQDPEDAYFADGVQDEILSDLARVADLKVISRTSVMQYKSGVSRNVREIGRQLGVAHVVEGSVERSGNRVRVNAQLIDARTDRHLWGQTYDRELSDVFAIQNEIAMTIAGQLQARLSPAEKNAIEQVPTSDIPAFDLFTRANDVLATVDYTSNPKASLLQAVDLTNQAVTRDPTFLRAYCLLAWVHDYLYFLGFDHTRERLALAEAAIEAASRLRPEAGETHLARAWNLYLGYLDYDAASAELEIARQALPNNPRILRLMSYIQRRQGRWEESTRNLKRALDRDPRNGFILQEMAGQYLFLRRYGEAKALLTQVLTFEPERIDTKAMLASIEFQSKAETQPLHRFIDTVRTTTRAALPSIAEPWLTCAFAERDAAAAKGALIASGQNTPLNNEAVHLSRPFVEGVIARMTKDYDKARSAFITARAEQEKVVQAEPNYGPALCVLGLIDAGLGRKEEALREGQRAVELLTVEKDAIQGPAMIKYFAMIAAWVGDRDLACEQLASVIRRPSDLCYGELKLLPFWDPLRGDPRFEKVVASLAPKEAPNVAAEKSIAVLSFANLNPDPDNAYFAGGIQAQIVARLAKIANLKIVSGSPTHRYQSTPENPAEVAAELGVADILEGSVQRQGEKFRIAVRLIVAKNNAELWTQSNDFTFPEVAEVESKVAAHIASALGVDLIEPDNRAMDKTGTSNPRAYEAYLKGRYVWLQRKWDGYRQAKEYFEQAIALDPNYAQAYAGLADAYQFLAESDQHARKENIEKAKTVYKRALELDSTLAQAHATAGLVAMNYDWDWPLAEQELRRAIALDPSEALFYDWYAEYLMAVGRVSESIDNIERARELDPYSVIINSDVGKLLYYARLYGEAEAQLKETLRMDPDFTQAHRYLGGVYVATQHFDDAIAEFKMANMGLTAYAYGTAGRKTEAEQMLEMIKKLPARTGDFEKVSLLMWAYIGLGEKDRAIGCLEQECENHSVTITSLKSNPEWDSLRSEPRFVDLMRRVHLVP
ncbi:MAG TPA: FlgO family outer membrane protein [Candidatus Udaeobacter sp.]|nr:FlgO family outer membrane protein [Candidatus Udaeobacter sp.]